MNKCCKGWVWGVLMAILRGREDSTCERVDNYEIQTRERKQPPVYLLRKCNVWQCSQCTEGYAGALVLHQSWRRCANNLCRCIRMSLHGAAPKIHALTKRCINLTPTIIHGRNNGLTDSARPREFGIWSDQHSSGRQTHNEIPMNKFFLHLACIYWLWGGR
jgi:hypothetical protein